MSVEGNARSSQIMRNVESGHYHKIRKFFGYGSIPEDRPNWDMRVARHGQALQQITNNNTSNKNGINKYKG